VPRMAVPAVLHHHEPPLELIGATDSAGRHAVRRGAVARRGCGDGPPLMRLRSLRRRRQSGDRHDPEGDNDSRSGPGQSRSAVLTDERG
jgi:hypothetical protein